MLIALAANVANLVIDINFGVLGLPGLISAFFLTYMVYTMDIWVYWSFSFSMLKTSRNVEEIFYNMVLRDNPGIPERQKEKAQKKLKQEVFFFKERYLNLAFVSFVFVTFFAIGLVDFVKVF